MIEKLLCWVSLLLLIAAENDKPYGLVNKIQTECEYDAMSVGSKLGDNYNSFDETTGLDKCLNNDYFIKNLGFVDYLQQRNTTTSGGSSSSSSSSYGWTNCSKVSDCKYASLENKWIYMIGDSKMHQIWETFLRPLTEEKLNVSDYIGESCTTQYATKQNEGKPYPDEAWGASGKHV